VLDGDPAPSRRGTANLPSLQHRRDQQARKFFKSILLLLFLRLLRSSFMIADPLRSFVVLSCGPLLSPAVFSRAAMAMRTSDARV